MYLLPLTYGLSYEKHTYLVLLADFDTKKKSQPLDSIEATVNILTKSMKAKFMLNELVLRIRK